MFVVPQEYSIIRGGIMYNPSLLTGPGFKLLSVRSFLSVCTVLALLAVFFGMSGPVAHAQTDLYYVNSGGG